MRVILVRLSDVLHGDDTIMCAVRTVPDTIHLMKKIENILND